MNRRQSHNRRAIFSLNTSFGVDFTASDEHRVEGDRIVEDWVIVESLGLFQQLELVRPTPKLLPQRGKGIA
jgi:hypothetical protein